MLGDILFFFFLIICVTLCCAGCSLYLRRRRLRMQQSHNQQNTHIPAFHQQQQQQYYSGTPSPVPQMNAAFTGPTMQSPFYNYSTAQGVGAPQAPVTMGLPLEQYRQEAAGVTNTEPPATSTSTYSPRDDSVFVYGQAEYIPRSGHNSSSANVSTTVLDNSVKRI
ncbi:hypothetical protein LSM04_009762 [Trypanosoma melophagium]|uniref:uncharacterized protein n=1 Tax=Trypanosoma melophagium TaxID=715481 RepID=UPI00351A529E|nr:hypothetical protein LSM04_009762 [Trypanosoma melophagium]